MTAEERYKEWRESPLLDQELQKELAEIENNENEIQDRFYKELEFGTAGLRGVIGAGSNRMNMITVRKATQGLANYMISCGVQNKGVVIAYDSRRKSPEFAMEAALCLCANGIPSYVFGRLTPTPELSYAVRKLGAGAGINITASHNGAEYNGYKVYWEDGAQITPPEDLGIMCEVRKLSGFDQMKTMERKEAEERGLLTILGEEMEQDYLREVKKLSCHPEAIQKIGQDLTIVYTPLHGTGRYPVLHLLKDLGYTKVYPVKEQEEPDGNFPTVTYPNPEAPEAFVLGLDLAQKVSADLVLATDPDADRLGVYVRDTETGQYHCLTGNQSGCLLGEYLLSQKKAEGILPDNGVFVKSIVSTNMADAIAERYQIELVEVLTGFKYIGEKMLDYEISGEKTFLFGMEESYGCLAGTYARDKDAVAATMLLCEAAAWYKSQGSSLWQGMKGLWETYGYYRDGVISMTYPGKDGAERIAGMMKKLRSSMPELIGGFKVNKVRDYQMREIEDRRTGEHTLIKLPQSNVIYLELEEDAWVCIRPSGTEPKIKLYYGVRGKSPTETDKQEKSLKIGMESLLLEAQKM